MKTLAFYLPQFHPFIENDKFWGKGFTEWRNVARATPQYEGHLQPNIPSELGFYDLRLSNILEEQFTLANQYGIDGFIPYLYWFCDGKVLMNEAIKKFSQGNTPYALCWANESWTRRWDGNSKGESLIKQLYSDPYALAQYLQKEHFKNSHYIKDKNDRPLFIIYRPHESQESVEFIHRLKTYLGSSVLLLGCESFEHYDYKDIGLEGTIQFPPHRHWNDPNISLITKNNFEGRIMDYSNLSEQFINDQTCQFKTVCPAWDNTPRLMSKATIFRQDNSAINIFENWVREAKKQTLDNKKEFMFINAWNEWAEGAFLEPDVIRGRTRLESLYKGLND